MTQPNQPNAADGLKVFMAFSGFYYPLDCLIGHRYTPPSEHLYSWTAFWTSCCFVCTHYGYSWPFVGDFVAWTGFMKNSGMLWSSCPNQGTHSTTTESWPLWIAALVVTILATGSTFYRVFTAQWTVNTGRAVRLDEEST